MSKFLLLAITLLCFNAEAARSYQAKKDFSEANHCPSTNKASMSCKGYVIDHKVPLCANGSDSADNMQWSLKNNSYTKDAEERFICRKIKAGLIQPFKNKDTFCNQIQKYKLPMTKVSVCR
jgi:hypothetical protein